MGKKEVKSLVLSKNSYAIDCKNVMLRSEDKNQCLVGLGIENIIAVAMQDAVLIIEKSRSQEVKKIVDLLSKNKKYQSENSETGNQSISERD